MLPLLILITEVALIKGVMFALQCPSVSALDTLSYVGYALPGWELLVCLS